jgi:DNA-binding transcriptional regulator GbsR (MarR family)
MKQLLLIFAVVFLTACGPSNKEEVDENMEVTSETSKNIEEAQDLNTELEEIDGELDSLLTKIN